MGAGTQMTRRREEKPPVSRETGGFLGAGEDGGEAGGCRPLFRPVETPSEQEGKEIGGPYGEHILDEIGQGGHGKGAGQAALGYRGKLRRAAEMAQSQAKDSKEDANGGGAAGFHASAAEKNHGQESQKEAPCRAKQHAHAPLKAGKDWNSGQAKQQVGRHREQAAAAAQEIAAQSDGKGLQRDGYTHRQGDRHLGPALPLRQSAWRQWPGSGWMIEWARLSWSIPPVVVSLKLMIPYPIRVLQPFHKKM